MIDWFREWSKGIVTAVIIGTLIEMILPDNNSKKYIKIVIGIFIVYTIIGPAINQFSKTNLDEFFDTDEYIETSSNAIDQQSKNTPNVDDYIEKVYIQNLQSEIKTKLKTKGYIVGTINISIADDGSYIINKLEITINEKQVVNNNQKQAKTIVDTIRAVTVKIENSSEKSGVVSESDKNIIKQFICDNYDVPIDKIQVY